MLAVLSPEERRRADSFLVQPARNTFVQVRALLRLVLAKKTASAASDVRFQYGDFRKPALMDNNSGIHFNVAHSGDYALIAVAQGQEVGVDIERARTPGDLVSLAASILAPTEMERWRRLGDEARVAAFFFAWTAKEAVSKAVGQGLQLDFTTLETGIGDADDARAYGTVIAGKFGPCVFSPVAAPDGYSAAVALRRSA